MIREKLNICLRFEYKLCQLVNCAQCLVFHSQNNCIIASKLSPAINKPRSCIYQRIKNIKYFTNKNIFLRETKKSRKIRKNKSFMCAMWSDTNEHKCNIKIPHIAIRKSTKTKFNFTFSCMAYAFSIFTFSGMLFLLSYSIY